MMSLERSLFGVVDESEDHMNKKIILNQLHLCLFKSNMKTQVKDWICPITNHKLTAMQQLLKFTSNDKMGISKKVKKHGQ